MKSFIFIKIWNNNIGDNMREIKREIEVLQYLYSQVLMEKDTYSFIIKKYNKTEDENENKFDIEFLEIIENAINEFKKFLISIKEMLKNRDVDKKQDDLLFRVATYFTIDIEKNTENEVAKHLVHGSQVVLNHYIEKLESEEIFSKTIQNLSNRFIDVENKNIKSLSKFI